MNRMDILPWNFVDIIEVLFFFFLLVMYFWTKQILCMKTQVELINLVVHIFCVEVFGFQVGRQFFGAFVLSFP